MNSKLKKNSVVLSAEENNLLMRLDKCRITSDTEVPKVEYAFYVQGVGCMPLGDLCAIKAAPKNGKTTAIKKIVATVLSGESGPLSCNLNDPMILWWDSEQQMSDVKLIIEDIKKMTSLSYKKIDGHLKVYSLRKIDSKTMLEQLIAAIKAYRPDIVVIDGIAEFVDSVNDEVEAKKLIHQLMVASEEHHCAIICVLHENRAGNRDMKGHLGAMLTQKVAVVLGCKKTGDLITVSCTDSRHQGTPEWSIRFDEHDNIVDADDYTPSAITKNAKPSNKPNKKQLADAQIRNERIGFCLTTIQTSGGSIAKKDLIALLVNEKGMSRSNASTFLTRLINEDKVICETNKIITATPSEAVPS